MDNKINYLDKMKINSTEFQQNVGYYLNLAEKGERIIVEKKRPKGISFEINLIKNIELKDNTKMQKMVEKIKKLNVKFTIKDSVKYQRFYRS